MNGYKYSYDSNGFSPLYICTKNLKYESIRILFKAYPDQCINEIIGNNSPLEYAKIHFFSKMVNFINSMMDNYDIKRSRNRKPLLNDSRINPFSPAIANNDGEMIESLIKNGVNPLQNYDTSTLEEAISYRSFLCIDVLVSHYGVNAKDEKHGYSLLHYVVSNNDNIDLYLKLLNKGALLSLEGDAGVTPIDLIFKGKRYDLLDSMKKNGIPLIKDNDYSIIHAATLLENYDAVDFMLSNGIVLNSVYMGMTPLESSLRQNAIKLSCEAPANEKSIIYGIRSILNVRCFEEYYKFPLYLLRNGATLSLKNPTCFSFFSLLFYYIMGGNKLILDSRTYRDKGVLSIQSFFESENVNNDSIIERELIKAKEFMHIAAKFSPSWILQFFIDKGYDIDEKDRYGYRPIHYAINNAMMKNAKLLIKSGAILVSNSIQDVTLFHMIAKSPGIAHNPTNTEQFSYKLLKEVVAFIESKQRIDTPNKNGATPLKLSLDNSNFRAFEVFLKLDSLEENKGMGYIFPDYLLNDLYKFLSYEECIHANSFDSYIMNDFKRDNADDFIVNQSTVSSKEILYFIIKTMNCPIIRFPNGETLIHVVSKFKLLSLLNYLVKKGSQLNILDNNQQTPLHILSNSNISIPDFDVLAPMINQRDIFLRTPIFYSCISGSVEILKKLLENGALFNLRDKNGCYPIHYACMEKNIAAIEVLIKNGTSLICPNFEHVCPIHIIAKEPSLISILTTIKDSGFNMTCDSEGNSPLHIAVIYQNYKAVKVLSKNTQFIFKSNYRFETPLDIAASSMDQTSLGIMLNNGGRFIKSHGMTALKNAVLAQNEPLIKHIVKNGIIPHLKLGTESLLIHCVELGNYDAIEFLVNKCGVMQSMHNQDLTPFVLSYIKEFHSGTDFLMSLYPKNTINGVLSSVIPEYEKDCKSPEFNQADYLKRVKYYGLRYIPKELRDPDQLSLKIDKPNMYDYTLRAFQTRKYEILAKLFEYGASPNIRTDKQHTLLYSATKSGDIKMAELLLRNGANPNIDKNEDVFIETPLKRSKKLPIHRASKVGNVDLFILLISYGSSILEFYTSPEVLKNAHQNTIKLLATWDSNFEPPSDRSSE